MSSRLSNPSSPKAKEKVLNAVTCQESTQTKDFALKAKKTEHGEDYLAINPKGYIPALALDNGELLCEGAAIVQYIADLKPDSGLAPKAGTMQRYRLQEWLTFIGTELAKWKTVIDSAGIKVE